MPNLLSSLTVDEGSLVDPGACSETDPKTKRRIPRSTVALWKSARGGGGNKHDFYKREGAGLDSADGAGREHNQQQFQREKKMKLKEILKSDNPSRDQIVAAILAKAER